MIGQSNGHPNRDHNFIYKDELNISYSYLMKSKRRSELEVTIIVSNKNNF